MIEDGLIGSGETGRTTAHLTYALDDRYFQLIHIFGEEKAKLAAQSHKAAIDKIEEIINREHIDCQFKRIDGYLFLHSTDVENSLKIELKATHKLHLDTERLEKVP